MASHTRKGLNLDTILRSSEKKYCYSSHIKPLGEVGTIEHNVASAIADSTICEILKLGCKEKIVFVIT